MDAILGVVEFLAVIVLVAVVFIALMAAAMLAWGFRRALSMPQEPPEDPPEVVELRRRLTGGEISEVEFVQRMEELRRARR